MMIKPIIEHCSACLACMNVCPTNAIHTTQNNQGFIMPEVDESLCVNCNQCVRVCDFTKDHAQDLGIKKAYSLIAKNKKTLYNSTSGGAFTVLSDVILSRHGVIYGSVMDEDFSVKHIAVDDEKGRDSLRGSKYVQSHIGFTFRDIRERLEANQLVLFVGTPCQCAGLKSFLGKNYDNLYVVDFLCHGVPNNKMFKEHIDFLNNYYGVPSVGYTFRDKLYGWASYNNNNKLKNGEVKTRLINQAYFDFFLHNLSLRPSCYNCSYRSYNRPSDLTIADFWQIEQFTHKRNTTGVSLVLVNTGKGANLLKDSEGSCILHEYPVQEVLFRVSTKPTPKGKRYEVFWKTYEKEGYEAVVNKYFDLSVKSKIRFEIRKAIKKLHIR